MWQLLVPFGSALLGVVGTLLIYWLDPKQKARRQLVPVVKQIEDWGVKLDEALVKNDSDGITIAASNLSKLQHTKAGLLQQL